MAQTDKTVMVGVLSNLTAAGELIECIDDVSIPLDDVSMIAVAVAS